MAKAGLQARTSSLDSVFSKPSSKILLIARDLDMFRDLKVAQSSQREHEEKAGSKSKKVAKGFKSHAT